MIVKTTLPGAALTVTTYKRRDGLHVVNIGLLDKLDSAGNWQRVRLVYSNSGMRTRSAARWHGICRARELAVRPDILQSYGVE